MRKSFAFLCSVVLIAPCAMGAKVDDGAISKGDLARVAPLAGDYAGRWDSEVTENVYDDISRYELDDPVMRLTIDEERRPRVAFYLDPESAAAGEELDLLGFGCRSRVGELLTLDFPKSKTDEGLPVLLHATFDFDWGMCPSRVHAVSSNDLQLAVSENPTDGEYVARLKLLRNVQADHKVYVTEDGRRREVKVRPKEGGRDSLYHPQMEYCVQNDVGETEACFSQKSEVKRYIVPFPFPGLSALWYTKKTPKLEFEKGRKLEYHEAVFRRAVTVPD